MTAHWFRRKLLGDPAKRRPSRSLAVLCALRAHSALISRVAAQMREFGASAFQGFFNTIDPKATFKIGPVNGPEAKESGLWLKAWGSQELPFPRRLHGLPPRSLFLYTAPPPGDYPLEVCGGSGGHRGLASRSRPRKVRESLSRKRCRSGRFA